MGALTCQGLECRRCSQWEDPLQGPTHVGPEQHHNWSCFINEITDMGSGHHHHNQRQFNKCDMWAGELNIFLSLPLSQPRPPPQNSVWPCIVVMWVFPKCLGMGWILMLMTNNCHTGDISRFTSCVLRPSSQAFCSSQRLLALWGWTFGAF